MIFVEDMEFDGKTYDAKQDKKRLSGNLLAVFDVLKNGEKMTLFELSKQSGVPLNSVSSRFRDLRKRKFGGYNMRSERLLGGTWVYWMEVEK